MKLYKRSLSLLLVCLLCFGLFSVNAYAVEESENLVDSNLSNWVDCGESLDAFQSLDITSSNNNNIISVQSNSKGMAIIFDLTEFLKVGESYEFSFTLPNTNNTGLGSYSLKWYLANSIDGPVASESKELVVINSSNKSDFLGKTTTYEFTYTEGYKNTCLALYIWGNDGLIEFPSTNFYINDVSLIRVTSETEKKLDGILGWLEDIKNSIIGLGDKLTSVWQNITSSISSLGDRISVFFSELSNTISTKFNELTTNFSNFITNLGDRISGFFDNLITNVKTFFEELPGKIFNYQIIEDENGNIIGGGSTDDGEDEEVDDKYHSFSLENSSWTSFYTNGCSVTPSLYSVFFKKPDYARISKFEHPGFSVSAENDIVLNFNVSSFTSTQNIVFTLKLYSKTYNSVSCEINGNGDYSLTLPSSPINDVIYLEITSPREGNSSYGTFSEMYFNMNNATITFVPINDTGSSGDTGSDEGSSGSVSWFQFIINKFKSWFSDLKNSIEGFFIKLYEDIKGLFIPSDGYFEDLSNRFDLLIEQRFGALVTITDYLVEFFSSFNADVTKEYFDVPIININLMGYNFPIGGWQVRFVPQFNGVEILTNACKFISSVLATFAFFDGLKKKYHEVFGGGE